MLTNDQINAIIAQYTALNATAAVQKSLAETQLASLQAGPVMQTITELTAEVAALTASIAANAAIVTELEGLLL